MINQLSGIITKILYFVIVASIPIASILIVAEAYKLFSSYGEWANQIICVALIAYNTFKIYLVLKAVIEVKFEE